MYSQAFQRERAIVQEELNRRCQSDFVWETSGSPYPIQGTCAGARSCGPKSTAQLLQAERDQKADHARVKDTIKNAETGIAALKKQKLGHNEMRTAIVTIRDRAILAVRDVRKNMAKRAVEAKNQLELLTDDFFRQRLSQCLPSLCRSSFASVLREKSFL